MTSRGATERVAIDCVLIDVKFWWVRCALIEQVDASSPFCASSRLASGRHSDVCFDEDLQRALVRGDDECPLRPGQIDFERTRIVLGRQGRPGMRSAPVCHGRRFASNGP